MAGFIFV